MDEVGRGAWAGPLVAAAAIVDPAALPAGIADSKTLTKRRREALASALEGGGALVALGSVSAQEIDALGLTRANDLAMIRAVSALPRTPALVLVDGRRAPPDLGRPARAVIRGDARSLSIATASIVAKVARDRLMAALSLDHPGYGWERNAGYGAPEHLKAIHRLGITSEHRRLFRPVREAML